MTLITPDSNLGGQRYPFLDGMDWEIRSENVSKDETWLSETLGRADMSLRFAKGGKVTDIYADGLDWDSFLAGTGLIVTRDKGPFVAAKRLSRLFRPYFSYGFFETIDVVYDPGMDLKLWDGAGLISRAMLLRLIPNLKHLPDDKRRKLIYELRTLKRVEFTVQSDRGQDKGHAYVVEDLPHDFVLPIDTKGEVRLTSGQTFVGIQPVHSKDRMNLDVQSHINLHPFFGSEDLKLWLEAEGNLFLKALEAGDSAKIFETIDSTDELGGWWLEDYFARGGKTEWFASVVKALANQHSNKILKTNLDRFKLPIPGGRYYLFSDIVGSRTVPSGEICLDPAAATAWVSRDDYARLAGILGGADQDDALWCFPFTDHDGTRQILAWRSPNQIGEYVLLKPSVDSHTIEWAMAGDPISYPQMDANLLPPTIDKIGTVYGAGILPVRATKGDYTLETANEGIHQMLANAGALGMTCNLLLVAKAVYGKGPKAMPARLEQIIDAEQKTGGDLSIVKAWVFESAQKLVRKTPTIPASLHHRITGIAGEELAETITATSDHWLDNVIAMTQTHLHGFQAQVQTIANRCQPPPMVFEKATGWVELASEIRLTYVNLINGIEKAWLDEDDMDALRATVEADLDAWPLEVQRFILMGLIARCYVTKEAGDRISDSVAFLLGAKTEDGRQPGVADRTLEALTYFGILDALVDGDDGVLRYKRRPKAVEGQPVKLNGLWYSGALTTGDYATMGAVPKDERDRIKALIAEAARRGRYNGQTFRVRIQGDRKVILNSDDSTLGYVQRGHEFRVGATLTIQHAVAHDGNLFALIL